MTKWFTESKDPPLFAIRRVGTVSALPLSGHKLLLTLSKWRSARESWISDGRHERCRARLFRAEGGLQRRTGLPDRLQVRRHGLRHRDRRGGHVAPVGLVLRRDLRPQRRDDDGHDDAGAHRLRRRRDCPRAAGAGAADAAELVLEVRLRFHGPVRRRGQREVTVAARRGDVPPAPDRRDACRGRVEGRAERPGGRRRQGGGGRCRRRATHGRTRRGGCPAAVGQHGTRCLAGGPLRPRLAYQHRGAPLFHAGMPHRRPAEGDVRQPGRRAEGAAPRPPKSSTRRAPCATGSIRRRRPRR